MDGPTSVQEIRKLGYNGPIIGVTGQAMQNDIDAFKKCGVDQILIKPVTSDLLYDSLHVMGLFGENDIVSNTGNPNANYVQSHNNKGSVKDNGTSKTRVEGIEMV